MGRCLVSPEAVGPDAGSEPRGGEPVLHALEDVTILKVLGEGGRSLVYEGDWNGRRVALKVYKPRAREKHLRKHPLDVAEFEFRRNLAFFEAPGLARYVARPLAFLNSTAASAVVQERLDGELYYFRHQARGGRVEPQLFGHVKRMVELAHTAGLYDLDVHALNVMVVEDGGEPIPKLFDFNLVPWEERRRTPWVWLSLMTGLRSSKRRDLRMLRDFHDFSKRIPGLLQYFPTS
ncbi:hypothetical protein ACGF5M_02655 [Gemmatimonadota bacterium]